MFKTLRNIPKRAVSSMGYSLSGLRLAFGKEESVRLETLALAILIGILAAVQWPMWKKATLLAVFMIIPLTELINSAIEDLGDLVSPDYHPSIKAAKDKGSAAVLLAIVIGLVSLAALIFCP
ncbi:MAG: diacylglycerol kinase [Deltaproteobacteria bacterium]|jgi:diacylglycerol kinase (ATP)|nr:diacylglycerol kinase [Deltaproteobacteria bacterium]